MEVWNDHLEGGKSTVMDSGKKWQESLTRALGESCEKITGKIHFGTRVPAKKGNGVENKGVKLLLVH